MYDSRRFLQFVVDRKLEFEFRRDLAFSLDRELTFDENRSLGFDFRRDLPFGGFGPVFRGPACPQCHNLINPHEGVCRHCGTVIATRPVPRKPQRSVVPERVELMICPKCAARIPKGTQVCPNCRIDIKEWTEYIRKLHLWEEEQKRKGKGRGPLYPPVRSGERTQVYKREYRW